MSPELARMLESALNELVRGITSEDTSENEENESSLQFSEERQTINIMVRCINVIGDTLSGMHHVSKRADLYTREMCEIITSLSYRLIENASRLSAMTFREQPKGE